MFRVISGKKDRGNLAWLTRTPHCAECSDFSVQLNANGEFGETRSPKCGHPDADEHLSPRYRCPRGRLPYTEKPIWPRLATPEDVEVRSLGID